MRGLLWILLVPGALASAEERQIYRCLDAKGHTTLQNDPCPAGDKVKVVAWYVPERPPSAQEVERRRQEEEAQRARIQRHAGTAPVAVQRAYSHAPAPDPNSREARRQRCLQARKDLHDYQFKNGGQANDWLMQQHRKHVQDVCHGF